MMRGELAVLSGRSNPKLAEAAARVAGATLTACDTRCHSDGEIAVDIGDNVRGNDVFVIQSTCAPGNDYLMELLILIDALKRASAERITAVLPYFGYARQDRKNAPRQPITAKLVANLITTAGADRVLTIDLHAGQIMGFFDLPVDNLYARPVLMKTLQEILAERNVTNGEDICVVSPDAGGVSRARAYAKRLDAGLAIVDKRRSGPNEVAEMNVVGDVNKKVCVIVDDMVDTAGTLAKAADALLENGAVDVLACCTHPVLSGKAVERIEKSRISKLIVSDTIYHENLTNGTGSKRVIQLSVAGLLGEAMRRIHDETSVSTLFADQ